MSEYHDKYAPQGMKDRVDHILKERKGKLDASDVKMPDHEDMGASLVDLPKRRAYKKGGKVEGEAAHHHAGRKRREAGGEMKAAMEAAEARGARWKQAKAEADANKARREQAEWAKRQANKKPLVDTRGDWKRGGRAHRDMGGETAVQQLRPQVPTSGLYGSGFSPTHAGLLSSASGLKKGGMAKRHKRDSGGGLSDYMANKIDVRNAKANLDDPDRNAVYGGPSEQNSNRQMEGVDPFSSERAASLRSMDENGYKKGGEAKKRSARKDGGRAKGKTNINIIIGGPKEQAPPMVPPPPSAMPPGKPPLPPGAMGAMQPPGMGMPPGAGGGAPMGGGMPPQMPPNMMGPK